MTDKEFYEKKIKELLENADENAVKLVYVYANALTSKNRKEKRYEYR